MWQFNPSLLWHGLSALFFLAAGLCLYLALLNRGLMHLRDGLPKLALIVASGGALVGGSAALGWSAGFSRLAVVPMAVLGIAALAEVRRLLLRRLMRGAAPVDILAPAASLRRPRTTCDLTVCRYVVARKEWRGPPLRIAHVSDLHANDRLPASLWRQLAERVAEAKPDLVFLTGDFVPRMEYLPLLPGILAPLKGRVATFGVLGNHDYWEGADAVAQVVSDCGVDLLRNAWRRIEPAPGRNVLVGGCEAPWASQPWTPPPMVNGELSLALSHTPDNIHRMRRAGFALVFSGHCHAGQFRLPGLGSVVVPSRYGRLFDHGHFRLNGTHLFVTSGVGASHPPLRLYCPPDLFLVDIAEAK